METAMPSAMLILIGCQLLGELLRTTFHFPVPGPVIGMFLLALALGVRAKRTGQDMTPAPLKPAAESLIANMGLLFVPAGVGIIAEAGVIRKEWLPIIVAVAGSTILSLMVTALVMHWTLPRTSANPADREGGMS
ncbi:murein hydrolase transporter LrgA [Gluconacetobacter liquefaciens]|uniref:CidA/LrgA family protein n=2 Tax=Gluconacetobacter liquefaciens TaxID=89584 RepID=A0A7W4P8V9_GLULI|nr:CidA/LrgA family protein [Gluconacetobacter liquefaciens]MBB2185352.1 CidA/LrgA family protein [Gluconacetobacter liquefaciens]GEB39419.1 murein hydrolase transporter LrgA [Gluconacetobacter liquefaciens]